MLQPIKTYINSKLETARNGWIVQFHFIKPDKVNKKTWKMLDDEVGVYELESGDTYFLIIDGYQSQFPEILKRRLLHSDFMDSFIFRRKGDAMIHTGNFEWTLDQGKEVEKEGNGM